MIWKNKLVKKKKFKKSKANVSSSLNSSEKMKKMVSAKKPKLKKIFSDELPDDEIVNLDNSGDANEDDRLSNSKP
jgi:hypothetical protein